MTITRRRVLVSGSAFAGTSLLPSQSRAQGKPVTLAFGPTTPIYAIGMIAELKNYFRDEGLNSKLITGNSGSFGRQMLASDQAMFAHGDASHPLQLTARGKACKILLATEMACSYANVVVRQDLYESGITSLEKLAAYKRPDGAKPIIAATAIGSGSWVYGTYLFEARGLGGKVNWVAGGGQEIMFPSLETKQFDAIMAPPSWIIEIKKKGFGTLIYDTSQPGMFEKDFGGTVPVLVVYTLADTIEQDKPTVQAFVNAIYRAMKWVKTTPLAEVQALVAPKWFSGIDPTAVSAELGFDKLTWAYDGNIDKAAYDRGSRIWSRKGTEIPETAYEDVVDMSFLNVAKAKYK
ncbi:MULTISPECIES: ABC transporter substrate-binding protein [Bradyrhizobium]|uniref:ABC transporter substrate-binding protein n=3 Tax=Bradyrhizobium TaxID=374 RepID=A0A410VI61_9BRAD|nr:MULTISPECIES: ABC transporter substrate-binding protein [Bradyrhizobium]MCG2628284.1 ABC transporter substrate-binding protein [Bradyrhizobium zhengyangense]MCG2670282.1 ABC transporter substrate-binding protein [Bradyrhizobium zhengyangense]MDN5002637.1 ABC transporter substrate-binding protein [Bradyrhizobium sp. WYCCWR 12677]MDT4736826.1 ABC transporter substrate-binding protein [Bradyrhizobium sp. WYCCWR 12699]QAU43351.1 ABC transporter substrate-binding protein [Bradyrhizobium guangdon